MEEEETEEVVGPKPARLAIPGGNAGRWTSSGVESTTESDCIPLLHMRLVM